MDNHHVNINHSSMSCGVVELSRLESDSRKVLFAIANHEYHPSRGQPHSFVVWSDVGESNGEKLAKEINRNKLGSWPWKHGPILNPQTGNMIFMWVWMIDHEIFRNWYKEEKIKRIKGQ